VVIEIEKQFEMLWNDFNNELSNYIKSKVSQVHDAEDLLQEVYIKIYKNLDQLEKQAAVKSWIFKITKNTIIDYYKKKKDLLVTPDDLAQFVDSIESEDNMNDEISECLKHMIFDLPEKYKDVYDLYENKNMKHSEIVKELDISLSTSKVRLMRAKEMFKNNLVQCCDFEIDKYGNVIDYKKKENTCNSCNESDSTSKC